MLNIVCALKNVLILGTGKIRPYVDKKHFFQELKNPPKKVLKDLVPQTNQELNTFEQKSNNLFKASVFDGDPFGEDPFKEDPFAEADFLKQDPFNTDNCVLTGERTAVGLFKQSFAFQNDTLTHIEAPAPPPRPLATNIVQIEPPPLPPKKVKPPPRPPHHEEARFEATNESAQSSSEFPR